MIQNPIRSFVYKYSLYFANVETVTNQARIAPILANKRNYHQDTRSKSKPNSARQSFLYGSIALASIVGASAAIGARRRGAGGDLQAFTIGANYNSPKFTTSNYKERIIARDEVRQHNCLEKGVWITYRGIVYDITQFVAHHPGGSQTIMMGAGGDVEPFWQTYTVHEAAEVQGLLSKYKIGVLPESERIIYSNETIDKLNQVEGPYSNDPMRSPLLKVLTKEPFNAETPANMLTRTFITPVDIFFVRNHLPVPEVDLKDYKLTIALGTDGDPDNQKVIAEYTLDDLKDKFKPHTIDCIIQCSGNRRNDLKKIKEIKGLGWEVGAISNARWTGVRLVDLLDSLEKDKSGDKFNQIKHVQLEGLDCDMSGQSYGASISSDVAFDPKREVLLAYEMNGKPLSRDHGFPLRFVAPGVTGARNVKWLNKIILSDEESNSHWQRNDYKSFSPNVDMFNLDYKQSISIQEMPVQSAICEPANGAIINLTNKTNSMSTILSENNNNNLEDSIQTIPVKGYAYSGGGKMIVRVDVSTDGGKTWMTANLIDAPKNPNDNSPDYTKRNQVWSWTRWSLDVEVPRDLIESKGGKMELLCRAFDSSYNSQPERAETVWNARGVVNNSWHKIMLNVKLN